MTVSQCIDIDRRLIGMGHPAYLIAEISANHNQSYQQAVELIHAAKEVGADAVKIQTYTPDTLTIDVDTAHFRLDGGTPWDGRTLYQLYEEAYTPWDWQPKLNDEAKKIGISFFSTAFDATSVDFLEAMDVPAYKVASFEIVDIPLIRKIAATGKPMILSTGMATLAEIEAAVGEARLAGAGPIALLRCTSAYPASPEGANLRNILHLAQTFHAVPGLSDHTTGTTVPVAAVALGAKIIEKHFTLSRSSSSPDASFSLEPAEFRTMVDAVRIAEQALGDVTYGLGAQESSSQVFRRSLFIVEDTRAGEELTARNVRSIRPGYGLPPKYMDEVLGRHASRDLTRGTPLDWTMVDGEGQ